MSKPKSKRRDTQAWVSGTTWHLAKSRPTNSQTLHTGVMKILNPPEPIKHKKATS